MSKAIFLGSFNPPHKGHINAVNSVIKYMTKSKDMDIEKIHIIPCWQNPNKEFSVPYFDRYQMCFLEFASLGDYCILDDVEEQIKPKYTYELLDYFHSNEDIFIKDDFWWIITEETLKEIIDGKWKESERILKENKFILITEYDLPDPYFIKSNISNDRLILVPLLKDMDMKIHSTKLREKIKNNENVYPYLNLGVQTYINQHNLYK